MFENVFKLLKKKKKKKFHFRHKGGGATNRFLGLNLILKNSVCTYLQYLIITGKRGYSKMYNMSSVCKTSFLQQLL